MNRRPRILVGVSACVMAAMGLTGCREPAPVDRPNVVLVVIDALRQDRIEARRDGAPVMPFLDGLRGESLYFTHAYSPCSWTKPAMASVLTSLYSDAHQVYHSSTAKKLPKHTRIAPDSLEFMAEFLRSRGYDTACVQTNPHLTREMGIAQGFNHYQYMALGTADVVTSAAMEALNELEEPFFLYVHYIDPHAPYWPPERYQTLFGDPASIDPAELDLLRPETFNDYVSDEFLHGKGWLPERKYPPLSEEGRALAVSLYDGEARFADDQVARLHAALDARLPRTTFIVTADHGEELWERGQSGHGCTLFEEVVRVPLMFSGCGISSRTVVESVETVDILPTVAGVLSLEPRSHWQGTNLLDGPWPKDRPVYSQTRGSSPLVNTFLDMALRDSTKLVVDHLSAAHSLYDVASGADVEEARGPEPADVAAPLLELLDLHHNGNLVLAGELGVEEVDGSGTGSEEAVSEEAAGELEALGYL
ncbi:MAG: sulfatase [bacterium]|nr:sulfatase [bacterium]